MSGIVVNGLMKRFPSANYRAVDSLSLTVAAGTFVSLLGASGSGKTTTLRMIAGLETPDSGEITIGGTTVFSDSKHIDIAPHRRPTSMVFQSYALWPHMSVFKNIAYPLRRAQMAKTELTERVAAVLTLLKCDSLAHRYPSELSGGQQQRIALGRAIVNPATEVILFDEPLSNLDAKLRDELRHDLRQLQEDLGFTALYVTHDQAEAMSMSDRVVVMRDGRIEREGEPAEVFHQPVTSFVAKFFGAQNIIPGTIVRSEPDHVVLDTELGDIHASAGSLGTLALGRRVSVAIPASAIHIWDDDGAAKGFNALVTSASYYGDFSDVQLAVGDDIKMRCRHSGPKRFQRGSHIIGAVVGDISCVVSGPASESDDG